MRFDTQTIFDTTFQKLSSIYSEGEAKTMTYWLLEDLLKVSKTDILSQVEGVITEAQEDQLSKSLERLLQNEPIQYVLGRTMFFGRTFLLNQHVLIPRQETEELIEWIIKRSNKSQNILDIGTGSGCIGISLALELNSQVTGWDVSVEAISLARENASLLNAQVHFEKADVLDQWPSVEKFDLIVSNPPYVLKNESGLMQANVLDYEPHLALFVENNDPLIFYRRIVQMAATRLNSSGWLYFEINESYGDQVCHLMTSHGFANVEIKKDLNGKDRMVRGSIE